MMLAISAALALLLSTSATDSGIAAFNAGQYTSAIKLLAQRSDPQSRAFLALARAASGGCATALPELTAEHGVPDSVNRLLKLAAAKCEIEAGDMEHASALLNTLARRYSNDADVLYLTAKLHMQAFNDATRLMYDKTPSSYRVHQLSAEVFESQGRFSDAITEYKKAIDLNPTAPDLHYHLGRATLLLSHTPEALASAAEEFRRELKISPEDAASEFQLGQIARAQSSSEEAREHFDRASSLSPTFVAPLIALGQLYNASKQYKQAIEALARATRLQPDNEAAHYALMTAYRNSGDLTKAKQENETLTRLRKPPAGEFSDFLKRLGQGNGQQ